MKNLLVVVLMSAFSAHAWAQDQDLSALNTKVDELELAQDVEDMEDFGEAARAQVAKQESKDVQSQTKRLEKEIAQMQRQNEKSKSRIKNLNSAYYKKSRLAAQAEKRHNKTEREKNRLESRVDKLRSKVDRAEQRAISAVEARKAADKRIAELKREERSLKHRERVAERSIQRNQKRLKNARRTEQRLSRSNRKIRQRVSRLESRAESLAAR